MHTRRSVPVCGQRRQRDRNFTPRSTLNYGRENSLFYQSIPNIIGRRKPKQFCRFADGICWLRLCLHDLISWCSGCGFRDNGGIAILWLSVLWHPAGCQNYLALIIPVDRNANSLIRLSAKLLSQSFAQTQTYTQAAPFKIQDAREFAHSTPFTSAIQDYLQKSENFCYLLLGHKVTLC